MVNQKNKSLIGQIKEKNNRANGKYLRGNIELYGIEKIFRNNVNNDLTINSLCLIGIAACLEVAVREAIKELVDHGPPFIERIERFNSYFRFDLELTRALSEGQISFGELVAHLLPVSNFSHISSHMEALLSDKGDLKFSHILRDIREHVGLTDEEVLDGESSSDKVLRKGELIVDNVDSLSRHIEEIFQMRHIAAHEASFNIVGKDKLSEYLISARIFVTALYELITQKINPGIPRGAFGSSIHALQEANKFHCEMLDSFHEILKVVASGGEEKFSMLGQAMRGQRAYDDFMYAEIEFHQSVCRLPGNGMRNLDAKLNRMLWTLRRDFLREIFENVQFFSGVESIQSTPHEMCSGTEVGENDKGQRG